MSFVFIYPQKFKTFQTGKLYMLNIIVPLSFQVQGARVHQDDEWPLPLMPLQQQLDSWSNPFDPSDWPIRFSGTAAWPIKSASSCLCPIASFAFVSSSSVDKINCRVELVACCHFASPAEINWIWLCGDVKMAAVTWSLMGALTPSDKNWRRLWH